MNFIPSIVIGKRLLFILLCSVAGNGTLQASPGHPPFFVNSISVEAHGAVLGTGQSKATRLQNWRAFQAACTEAVNADLPVYIGDVLEIWNQPGNWIALDRGDAIRILGAGPQLSIVDVYPKVAVATGAEYGIFKAIDEGVSIHLEDCQFQGPAHLDRLQTYRATLKPAGRKNALKINRDQPLWPAFWENLRPGAEILYTADFQEKIGYTGIVKSIDPDQGLIVLEADLHSSIASDTKNEGTHIGTFWPENTAAGTIDLYSRNWYDGDLDQFLISYVVGFHNYEVPATITFKNTVLENFLSVLNRLGGNIQMTIENSRISGIKNGIGFFSGEKPDNPSAIAIDNMELYNCGLVADGGSINRNYVSAGQPPIWGSGFYIHPNVVVSMRHSKIHDNPGGAFRQYSSSGASSKPARENLISTFDNIDFSNNGEFSLLTSGVMRSKITNCTFNGFGMLKLNYAAEVQNCSFDVPLALDSSNDPNYQAEPVFDVTFENCRFEGNAQFTSGGWEPEELNKVVLTFNRCEFNSRAHPVSSSPEAFLKIRSDRGDASFPVFFNNCSVNFPPGAQGIDPDEKGTGAKVRPFLRIGPNYSGEITVENLQTNNAEGKVFLYNGIEFERPYYNAKCTFRNSDLSSWLWLQGLKTRNSFKHVVQLEQSPFFGDAQNSLFYVNSFQQGQTKKRIDPENFYYGNIMYRDNLVLDDEYDTYFVEGKTLRNISYFAFNLINPNPYFHGGTSDHRFRGTITLIPQEELTIVPFGVDQASNIAGDRAITVAPDEAITLEGVPDECLSANPRKTKTHTIRIGTGNGDKISFVDNSPGSKELAAPVPGSLRLKTSDGLDIATDSRGLVSHARVEGAINPYNEEGGWELNFAEPPAAGVTIDKVFESYESCEWKGYWRIVEGNEQAALDLQVETNGPLACSDAEDGWIQLQISGGKAPHEIQWSDPALSGNSVNGLSPGAYQVTITDAGGATQTRTITLEAPDPLMAELQQVGPTDCNAGESPVVVSVRGGVAPYSILWSDGVTSAEERRLPAGEYEVTVIDGNGCDANAHITIETTAEPTVNFDFTVDGKTVSFFSAPSLGEGMEQEWSFGDGQSSNAANPIHEYETTGTFRVCLTRSGTCGEADRCRDVQVGEDTDLQSVWFELSESSGTDGNLVEIPVTVRNFRELLSFEFALGIPAESEAVFAGIGGMNLRFLSDRSFEINDKKTFVTWRNPLDEGISVDDDDPIFTLMIRVPPGEVCHDVFFHRDNQQDDISVFGIWNDERNVFPYDFSDGRACGQRATVIRGSILSPDGMYPLEGVTVTASGWTAIKTGKDGSFLFETQDAVTGPVEVRPIQDDPSAAGVSILDLIKVRKHILHYQLIPNIYDQIAADVNASGGITSLDLLMMQQVILGRKQSFPAGAAWKFIPRQFRFPKAIDPLTAAVPESILIDPNKGSTNSLDFYAIKLGDVDQSHIRSRFGSTATPDGSLNFLVENQEIEAGQTVTVTITAANFEAIIGYQMEWHYAPDALEFINLEEGVLSDPYPKDFVLEPRQPGILTNLWFSERSVETGQTVNSAAPLFTLQFRALRPASLEQILWLGADFIRPEAYRVNEDLLLPQIQFTEAQQINNTNVTISPNPALDRAELELAARNPGTLQISIYNSAGQLAAPISDHLIGQAGLHRIPLDLSLLDKGIYFIGMQLGFEKFTRMIVRN